MHAAGHLSAAQLKRTVRITKLQCRGLYSYRKQVSADVSNRVVIVGPNNSGKSNLFRIIRLLADTLSMPPALKDGQITKGALDPSLGLHVKLSREETEKIVDFFSFYVPDAQGMRFHEYENRDQLASLLDEIAVKLSWKKTAKYGIRTSVEIQFLKLGLVVSDSINNILHISDHAVSEQEATTVNRTKPLRDLLIKLSDPANAKSTTAEFFQDRLLEMHDLKEDHHKIPEHGKRTLADLQSYVGLRDTADTVRFTRLVGEILAKSTVHSPDNRDIDGSCVQNRIESLKLLPGQEEVLGSGEAEAYNEALVRVARFKRSVPAETLAADGSNLSSFLLGLKTSPVPADRERFESIRRAFASVFAPENLRLDVILERPEHERNPAGRPHLRRTFAAPAAVIADESGEQFPAADAGAGVRESIYMLALVLGSRDSVVLLDEPSINMHPGLARAILGEICGNDGNQILITTHSPAIVGFMAFEKSSKVLYVRNAGSSSTVRALDGESFEQFHKDRRLRHLIDPAIFFAKCVVLVEGPSDQSLLAGVAEYKANEDQKYNLARRNIAILHINGEGNFGKYIYLLDAYKIPYVILADRDDGKHKRKKWLENRKTAEFPSDCESSIDANIVLVEKDLEHLLESMDEQAFRTAENIGGDSKIAVAMEFCKIIQQSCPQKLDRITSFLDYCIGRGLGEAGDAGQDRAVSRGG